MRIRFVNTLYGLAKKDKNIILLTGDLGFSVFEKFIEDFPDQFLNAGVAEQNMTGLAAGMAIEGKIPFIYSIVPFVTMRNFEQIRNDICYQNLNVKIVGVGSGFSYGPYGHTHHGLEDVAILRSLPNLTIFSPSDPFEAEFVTKEAVKIKGPVYIRLGKAGEPVIHGPKDKLKVGKGSIVKEGSDITIITTGSIISTVLEAVALLEKKNIHTRVVSMHTIKPIDENIVLESVERTKAIYTVEEHFLIGGLGSTVSEIISEKSAKKIKFKRIGVADHFTKEIGLQNFMREKNSLSPSKISKTIISSLSEK